MKNYILYRNLHTGLFSLCKKENGKKNHTKWKNVKTILIHFGEFKIWKGLQKKARLQKTRNVHAFIHFDSFELENIELGGYLKEEIYYNPFITDSFIIKSTKEPIEKANTILASDNKIFILKPKYEKRTNFSC